MISEKFSIAVTHLGLRYQHDHSDIMPPPWFPSTADTMVTDRDDEWSLAQWCCWQHPSTATYPHLCVPAPSDIPPLLHILTSVSLLHLTSLHCYISSPLCRCSTWHPSTATNPHLCVAAPSDIPPLLHILTSVSLLHLTTSLHCYISSPLCPCSIWHPSTATNPHLCVAAPSANIPPLLQILTSVSLLHLTSLHCYISSPLCPCSICHSCQHPSTATYPHLCVPAPSANIPPLLQILTSVSLLHLPTSLHCYKSSPLCRCSIWHPSTATYPHLCVPAPSATAANIPPLLHILTSVSLLHLPQLPTSLHCYISSPLCPCSTCQHPSTATYPHLCVPAPSANIPPLLQILTSVSLLHLPTSLHCYISSPLCPCSICHSCQHPSTATYPHLCVPAPSATAANIPPLLHILTSVSLLHLTTSLHCYISSPLCPCSICQHPSTATYPHLCVTAPSATADIILLPGTDIAKDDINLKITGGKESQGHEHLLLRPNPISWIYQLISLKQLKQPCLESKQKQVPVKFGKAVWKQTEFSYFKFFYQKVWGFFAFVFILGGGGCSKTDSQQSHIHKKINSSLATPPPPPWWPPSPSPRLLCCS